MEGWRGRKKLVLGHISTGPHSGSAKIQPGAKKNNLLFYLRAIATAGFHVGAPPRKKNENPLQRTLVLFKTIKAQTSKVVRTLPDD